MSNKNEDLYAVLTALAILIIVAALMLVTLFAIEGHAPNIGPFISSFH